MPEPIIKHIESGKKNFEGTLIPLIKPYCIRSIESPKKLIITISTELIQESEPFIKLLLAFPESDPPLIYKCLKVAGINKSTNGQVSAIFYEDDLDECWDIYLLSNPSGDESCIYQQQQPAKTKLLFDIGSTEPSGNCWSKGIGDLILDLDSSEPSMVYKFYEDNPPSGCDDFPLDPFQEKWNTEDISIWINSNIFESNFLRPSGNEWDFTGVNNGELLYVLPLNQINELPQLRLSALNANFKVEYTLDIESVIGGIVSAWQLDPDSNEPIPLWSSLSEDLTIKNNTIRVDENTYNNIYIGFSNFGSYSFDIEGKLLNPIPLKGAIWSLLDVEYLNNGVATSGSSDSLASFTRSSETPYNLIVGTASNNDIDKILNNPVYPLTLNLLFVDTLESESGVDQYNMLSQQTQIPGTLDLAGASNYLLNQAPGMFTAWFKGDYQDNNDPQTVISTFNTSLKYCNYTFRSEFDCKTEEWSQPTVHSITCDSEEQVYSEWELIDSCIAECKRYCLDYENFCEFLQENGKPAPPEFQPQDCCNKCIWKFKKIYDCNEEVWNCVLAELICEKECSSGSDWTINGCEATICIELDILCQSSGDCPTPSCDKAPPGPFKRPEDCCENEPPTGGDTNAICEPCVGNCKFLGCSVVGFNGSIGWNTQESMVNIDLVEVQCDIDGTGSPSEVFTGTDLIGYPVYFYCGGFFFGGLLQNWTYTSNSGGRTYNVKVVDPRQILEQCVLIIDTYAGPPVRTLNYFNVYGFYEEEVYKNKNCELFGTSESNERGMPYNKIIYALKNMNPTICTPVGANLTIDWSTFNIPVPDYFKIAGPSITILQLIVDICDEAGYDFFVTLEPGDIVKIYPVSLKRYDPIEDNLLFGFNNVIDFTYGKELRITKTRNLLFGEQQHYLDVVYWGEEETTPEAEVQYVFNGVTGEKQYSLTPAGDNTDPFEFYFGEEVDPETGDSKPIIPYKREFGQFWVDIDIRKLNLNLIIPFPVDRINVCEYDIRTAMTSFESFWSWTAHEETPSELGQAMQLNWPITYTPRGVLTRLNESAVTLAYALADAAAIPNSDRASANLHSWPPILEDIKKIHEWIAEFGRTYYGRQYLVRLNEKICVKDHPEDFGEKMYTDTPTNDGGWVEPGIPVMGLKDPDLGLFRTDDDRVGPFALFCNPDNMNDILNYSGSGGGDYSYTLGSGILDISEPPPSSI